MKLKKLEITGFKSFVDRTVVQFDHNVTAIVGPNGCGKSNVVDAIKWCMGEQAPGRLRGKAMDDVIFAGSEDRGPHGFAEVSLTFDNTDGLAPAEYKDYAEITVTRRLDRQGNSEYIINRTPVRLMDVTNLFLGTGVGRRAYSIIEQGRIGFIVSSKPEDRRHMIEEAAGVTKFKARKRAAERKMEQTRQNLLRVGDIVGELEKTLASLKRQAQKAERYKNYRAEMRDLELYVASHKWLELLSQQKVVSRDLAEASAKLEGARAGMRIRESEVEAERNDLDALGAEVDQQQNRAYELDNQLQMLEGQIQQQLERLDGLHERERITERELQQLAGQRDQLQQEREGLQAALEQLETTAQDEANMLSREDEELQRRRESAQEAEREMTEAQSGVSEADTRIARAETVLQGFEQRRDDARNRLEKARNERAEAERRAGELEREIAEIDGRLKELRESKERTANRQAELDTQLERLREELRESDERVEALREELANKRSRLRSLEELQQRFEGMGAGVRAVMTEFAPEGERSTRGVHGVVADRLDVPAELTRAFTGALGDRLQDVVVDNQTAASAGVGFLHEGEHGRATFVPKKPRQVAGGHPPVPNETGVVGRLAAHVRHEPGDEALVESLVGDVIVVDDLEVARRLQQRGVEARFVTRAGDLLRPDGSLSGGTGEDAGEHLLQVQREIRELHGVVEDLDRRLGEAVERHGQLRRDLSERQTELDTVRSEAHDAEIAIVKADKDHRRAQDERERMGQRIAQVDGEIRELSASLDTTDDEEANAQREIEDARQRRAETQQQLEQAEEVYRQRRASLDEQTQRVTEVRVRAAQAQQKVESDRATMERLARSVEELDEREQRLRDDVAEGAREQGRIRGELMAEREQREQTRREVEAAHQALSELRGRYEQARNTLGEHEVELKNLRTHIDELANAVNDLTLRERELSMEMQHLLDQVEERHRVDVRRTLGDYHHREVPDAQVTDRINELQRLIDRMGEINLTAIEEYEEKSQRYEYMRSQQQDLEDSLTQLDRAIRQMNRESRRLFRDAFEGVNERFKRIFPQLFQGGKGELRLTDPDNLLESGVDIAAQPPGKKLGSLELMSGGEKALTAVALIFALFQYHPSPFCLLDEVDAPLDEANLTRFAEAVRQMTDQSQFIVITHAKRTMEFADVLYGVTMEKPGVSNLVSVELTGERRPAPPAQDGEMAVA